MNIFACAADTARKAPHATPAVLPKFLRVMSLTALIVHCYLMARCCFFLLFTVSSIAAPPDAAIRRVLDDQVFAWNRGDVPAFMSGYENSAATTFVGAVVTKGHAQVLADYIRRYPTKEKMGRLEFTDLEVRPLCADYASVLGRFHLARSKEAGGDARGIFTLLFHKTAGGWKIIQDHTS